MSHTTSKNGTHKYFGWTKIAGGMAVTKREEIIERFYLILRRLGFCGGGKHGRAFLGRCG
jgi:hypothetical protein